MANNVFNFRLLYQKMQTENVVLGSAFAMGFFHHIGFNKDTLNHPLSTTTSGCIHGTLLAFGALIPATFLPVPMLPVISALCAFNIGFRKYNELYHPELLDTQDQHIHITVNNRVQQ